MSNVKVLFDRLAGCLKIYVENYQLENNGGGVFHLQPSYPVDYEISQDILNAIEQSYGGKTDDIWYIKISSCQSVRELPNYLQELISQFLPKFFEQFPQYKNAPALEIQKG